MEKNNYIVNCNFGSGVFSRFTLGIQELIRHPLDNLNQVYFDYQDAFNYVFDQSLPSTSKVIYTHKDISAYNGNGFLSVKDTPLINQIVNKLKIHPDIKVNPQITDRTLGIHIRLTDLMAADIRYNDNPYTTEDIIESTYNIMESGDYDNIFIASDNIESLEKFDKKFNFIHNNSQFIYHQEVDPTRDSDYLWLERFETPQEETKAFVQEAFLDMYSLSKCGGLMRIGSNLAVASLMFSNTINKIYGYKYSN
jgi:hypothetical protein